MTNRIQRWNGILKYIGIGTEFLVLIHLSVAVEELVNYLHAL